MPLEESYRTIELTKGKVTLVDAADYEWLNQWKWKAIQSGNRDKFYAVRYGALPNGENGQVRMHRLILGLSPGDGLHGDHIEPMGTLDNRRCNLRIATPKENSRNRNYAKLNCSGVKGVTWSGPGRWYAQVRVDGKYIRLGTFNSIEEARDAYVEGVYKYHGEFGRP